jgi:hypothetical protein
MYVAYQAVHFPTMHLHSRIRVLHTNLSVLYAIGYDSGNIRIIWEVF